MNTVTNKLEDTIWCNDRSFGNGNNNGWIANGGNLGTYIYYGAYQRSYSASTGSTVKNQPNLECPNKNDSFTVKSTRGNGKLQYPVALLTADEMVLAGGINVGANNRLFYLYNGSTIYWSLSPASFITSGSREFYMSGDIIQINATSATYGLRPAVSLKPGQLITSGTGTANDPYIIG
jgi:hypothetical protein